MERPVTPEITATIPTPAEHETHQLRRARCTAMADAGSAASLQAGTLVQYNRFSACHWRAITAGVQGTLQAARDREHAGNQAHAHEFEQFPS